MKKILIFVLAIAFVLAGCTSTNPALTSVLVENFKLANESFEGEQSLTISTNLLDVLDEEYKSDELAMLLEILFDGIKVEVKQRDMLNQYLKLTFNNADRVRDLPFWTVDAEPNVELLTQGNQVYVKTSAEDRWVSINGALGLDIEAQTESMQLFLTEAMQEYLAQFDYELDRVEHLGTKSVSTPAGNQNLQHIQVQLSFEDARSLLAYFLGNLAEYEHFDQLIRQYLEFAVADFEALLEDEELARMLEEDEEFAQFWAEFELTEEDLEMMVTEMRDMLISSKEFVEAMDQETLGVFLGFTPSLEIVLDFYVNNRAQLIKQDVELDLTLTPVNSPFMPSLTTDTLNIRIVSESLTWNIGGDVQLPNVTDAYDFYTLFSDPDELEKMNEGSVIKILIEQFAFTRYGVLTVGSNEAFINNQLITLDTAPFIEDGSTMVPFRVVAEIAQSDVKWDGSTQTITFELDGMFVVAQVGSNVVNLNGRQIELTKAPLLRDGRTFVPIRLIEQLGATVTWNAEWQMIEIEF